MVGRLSDRDSIICWVDYVVVVDEGFVVNTELYSLVGVEKGVPVEIVSLVTTAVRGFDAHDFEREIPFFSHVTQNK